MKIIQKHLNGWFSGTRGMLLLFIVVCALSMAAACVADTCAKTLAGWRREI